VTRYELNCVHSINSGVTHQGACRFFTYTDSGLGLQWCTPSPAPRAFTSRTAVRAAAPLPPVPLLPALPSAFPSSLAFLLLHSITQLRQGAPCQVKVCTPWLHNVIPLHRNPPVRSLSALLGSSAAAATPPARVCLRARAQLLSESESRLHSCILLAVVRSRLCVLFLHHLQLSILPRLPHEVPHGQKGFFAAQCVGGKESGRAARTRASNASR